MSYALSYSDNLFQCLSSALKTWWTALWVPLGRRSQQSWAVVIASSIFYFHYKLIQSKWLAQPIKAKAEDFMIVRSECVSGASWCDLCAIFKCMNAVIKLTVTSFIYSKIIFKYELGFYWVRGELPGSSLGPQLLRGWRQSLPVWWFRKYKWVYSDSNYMNDLWAYNLK